MGVSQKLTLTQTGHVVSLNMSSVEFTWTSTQTGDSYNGYTRTAKYYVSINGGPETEYKVSYTLPKGKTKTIVSTGIGIPHRVDGTGSVKIRTWMNTGISVGVVEKEIELTLPDIDRATSVESITCATNYFTGTLTYKYTPTSADLYTRCNISLNLDGNYIAVKSINIGKKSASQQTGTVTLSDSELETIYKKLPNDKTGVLRFTFRTYSDSAYSNQVDDPKYKEVTLTIPDDSTTQADVSMTLVPVGSIPDAFDGLYIQGKTKVKATLSAKGKHEATIKSYSMKVDGKTYDSGDSYTSDYLSKSGSLTVYGYAKDSRGYTGSTSEKITVIGYAKPKILDVEAYRCDKDGLPADDGTYLKIKAKRSYSPVKSDGVQKNFCKIRYRYKAASASSYSNWTTILAGDNLTSDEVETDALLNDLLAVDTTFYVQVQAIDDIGDYAETTVIIPTDKVHTHRSRNGIGFGKYCEGDNLMDVAWDAHFHGEVLIGETGMTLKDYILAVISEGG